MPIFVQSLKVISALNLCCQLIKSIQTLKICVKRQVKVKYSVKTQIKCQSNVTSKKNKKAYFILLLQSCGWLADSPESILSTTEAHIFTRSNNSNAGTK